MTKEKLCPVCSSPCDRDEVDIGVGVQYGPWHCSNVECGWTDAPVDDGTLFDTEHTELL
jgi:hypothetical protein